MNTSITQLTLKLQDFENIKKNLVSQYLSIINDKNIDLEERWGVFKKAPIELKNYQNSVLDLNVFQEIDSDFNWKSNFDIEHYELCELINIVQRLETKVKQAKGKTISNKLVKAFYKNPELFNVLKEEILQKNVGSFKFEK